MRFISRLKAYFASLFAKRDHELHLQFYDCEGKKIWEGTHTEFYSLDAEERMRLDEQCFG